MRTIEFFTNDDYYTAIPEPVPARSFQPEWYKDMSVKIDDDKDVTKPNITMKTCPGIVDSFQYGYIIPAWCDLNLKFEGDNFVPETSWTDQFVKHFSPDMYREFDFPKGHTRVFWKFTLPWRVKTSPGTSVLITSPKWHGYDFEIYEGIVDSDTYVNDIHAIITWDKSKTIKIKRGQPLLQIIPLVRDEWQSEVKVWGESEEQSFRRQIKATESYMTGGYRKHFWSNKKFN